MEDLATSGFELRFDLAGRAAVRVAGGPVAPRHVEPVPPPAPWVIEARCGDAAGWLLAHAAPADPEAARTRLERAVEREAAARLQAAARQLAPLAADLLERLTHRLRTDVTTLQAVADGAVKGLFEPADLELLPGELERSGREAQRRLSAAREVMGVLTPGARSEPEPVEATLRTELAAAGREATITGPAGEIPGRSSPAPAGRRARASWPATRGSTMFELGPDRGGWSVNPGPTGRPWSGPNARSASSRMWAISSLRRADSAVATEPFGVRLTLPAAPPFG